MTRRLDRLGTMGAAALVAVVAITACGGDDEASASDLNGKTFTVTDVEGFTLVDGSEVTIAFADDRLSAAGGCNTLNGGFTVTDGVLEVGELASTMMACDAPLMEQDQWLSDFLASGPSVELDGDELVLDQDDTSITLSAG